MFKKLSVVILGLAVGLMTSMAASAQSAAQEAKDKTKAAAQKTAEVVTDAEITSAVKAKLLADKTVGGLKIDVDTTDGVVTLTGPVHSGVERSQALKLARNTKGVKSVKNKLVLEKAKPDTTTGTAGKDIKEKSEKAAEKTGDAAKKAGQETKDAAVKTKDVVADATITSEVKTKLLADPKVGGLKIDVDTKDNVVTLTGIVNSVEEKNEALRLARTSAGVKSVVDKLTVKK
jgi:hyperosmotically inducible periplasmic protein